MELSRTSAQEGVLEQGVPYEGVTQHVPVHAMQWVQQGESSSRMLASSVPAVEQGDEQHAAEAPVPGRALKSAACGEDARWLRWRLSPSLRLCTVLAIFTRAPRRFPATPARGASPWRRLVSTMDCLVSPLTASWQLIGLPLV